MRSSKHPLPGEYSFKKPALERDQWRYSERSGTSSRGGSSNRSQGEVPFKLGESSWWETESSFGHAEMHSAPSSYAKNSYPVSKEDLKSSHQPESSNLLAVEAPRASSYTSAAASADIEALIPRDVLTDMAYQFGPPSRPSRSNDAQNNQRLWSSFGGSPASSSTNFLRSASAENELDHRISDLLLYHDELPVTIGAIETLGTLESNEWSKVLSAVIQVFKANHQCARLIRACTERCVKLAQSGKSAFDDHSLSRLAKSALLTYCAPLGERYFAAVLAPTMRGLAGPNRSLDTSLKGTCDRILTKISTTPCPDELQGALSIIYTSVHKRFPQRALSMMSGLLFSDLLGGYIRALQASRGPASAALDPVSSRFLGAVAQVFRKLGKHEPPFAGDAELVYMNDWIEGRTTLVSKITKSLTAREDADPNTASASGQPEGNSMNALHHFFVQRHLEIYRISFSIFPHVDRPPQLIKLWAAFDACQNRRRRQSPPHSAPKILLEEKSISTQPSFSPSAEASGMHLASPRQSLVITNEAADHWSPKTQRMARMKISVMDVDLSRRALTSIPRLNQFQSLQSLNISHNYIEALMNLPQTLRSLDASHNLLTEVSPITTLQNLEACDLSHNNISSVSVSGFTSDGVHRSDIRCLTRLMHLDLSYNKIESLKGLKNIPSLGSLYLKNNCIESVDEFKYLSINNICPRSISILENPAAQDFQYAAKIAAFVPSVEKIDSIPVRKQQDWTVAPTLEPNKLLLQSSTRPEFQSNELGKGHRWTILERNSSEPPSIGRPSPPSEIRLCSDKNDAVSHDIKDSTNCSWPVVEDALDLADSNLSQIHSHFGIGVQTCDFSNTPECSFRDVPEPFDFGKIVIDIENSSENKISTTELLFCDISRPIEHDVRNMAAGIAKGQSSKANFDSDAELCFGEEMAENSAAEMGRIIQNHVDDSSYIEDSKERSNLLYYHDEDILISLCFQKAVIFCSNIQPRAQEIRGQICSAAQIDESRVSYNQIRTDSHSIWIDYTLHASKNDDEATAETVLSIVCEQLRSPNSMLLKGSLTRWLVALQVRPDLYHQIVFVHSLASFESERNNLINKIILFWHRSSCRKTIHNALSWWKNHALKIRMQKLEALRIARILRGKCLSSRFLLWARALSSAVHYSLYLQRHCSHQALIQYCLCQNRNVFKKWVILISAKKHRTMLKTKHSFQARWKAVSKSFEALRDNACQCLSDKELQSTISYMTQCLKTHTVSAFRSLNAATTCLDLFNDRKNIQRLKLGINVFLNWKNAVQQGHLRLYALACLRRCWNRVQLQCSQRTQFRKWKNRYLEQQQQKQILFAFDKRFKIACANAVFFFWNNWKSRVVVWREVRCMAILYLQNRKKMANITRAWIVELESCKSLQRKQSLVACTSQQWQWRAFCTWMSESIQEPSTIQEIWRFENSGHGINARFNFPE